MALDKDYLKAKIKQFDMHSKFGVNSVKRMHRNTSNEDDQKQFIPTKTILISFRASVLPQHIAINHVRI